MLIPIDGQDFPSNGSSKFIEFRCSCGRNVFKSWKSYKYCHVSSCGKCNLITSDHFAKTKYGKLRMKDPIDALKGSNGKVIWNCDCGRKTSVSVCLVVNGNTSSCGKCNILTSDHFEKTKYGKLKMRDPKSFHSGSHKKVIWDCDCGRKTSVSVSNVTRRLTASCGKCNIITSDHFAKTKYGKLRMRDPESFHPGSEKITIWDCDCGKSIKTKVCYVTSSQTVSCGNCEVIDAEIWSNKKFGRLQMASPESLHPQSHKQVLWLCSCGSEKLALVHNVTRGAIVSCGSCYSRALDWYNKNKEVITSLQTPIFPFDIPKGNLTIVDVVINTRDPFSAICGSCGSTYKPRWGNVRLGRSLTCGCSNNRISKGHSDMADFISSLGFEVNKEFDVSGLKYDIHVQSKKLLIEYNGLRWHSGLESRKRDWNKYNIAIDSGYDFISIFEDEWLQRRNIIEQILRNRLNVSTPISLRLKQCEISKISSRDADIFLDLYHYIGPAKARINYGVFSNTKLIAVISFKRPTRQTSQYSWELVRMTSNPEFRVYGIWSKLFKLFRQEFEGSVVSFSDNRLFNGGVYEKLGFQFDGLVRPDYYWVKGNYRFHKSRMRKNAIERLGTGTETELRHAQGYSKIWDLGKKRWTWTSC